MNARDAMPGGGSLLIETELETRDGVAGVQLTVSDSNVFFPASPASPAEDTLRPAPA